MKTVRFALSVLSVLLLLAGYLASQFAALFGSAPNAAAIYAEKVDAAPIRILALVFLVAAIVFALIPEGEESS